MNKSEVFKEYLEQMNRFLCEAEIAMFVEQKNHAKGAAFGILIALVLYMAHVMRGGS